MVAITKCLRSDLYKTEQRQRSRWLVDIVILLRKRLNLHEIKMKREYGINENNETNGRISGPFRFMSTPSKKVAIIGVLMDLGADR